MKIVQMGCMADGDGDDGGDGDGDGEEVEDLGFGV